MLRLQPWRGQGFLTSHQRVLAWISKDYGYVDDWLVQGWDLWSVCGITEQQRYQGWEHEPTFTETIFFFLNVADAPPEQLWVSSVGWAGAPFVPQGQGSLKSMKNG